MRIAPGAPRVVVVGGGLAGLSAALRCAEGGAAVTLLEARPRLGGATFSFERDGLLVDNGQHVFLKCCTAYRDFLERIGASDRTVLQDRLAIPVLSPDGRAGWIRRSDLPAPIHLAGSILRYPFLRPMERLRIGPAALALRRLDPGDESLDRRTFASWLEEHGQSPRAIEALWNLISLPALNLPADRASLALAVKVFRTGLLEAAPAGDVGWARVPLSVLHADPAERALGALGAETLTRAPARGLRAAAEGRLEVTLDGQTLEADAVVVAVPHDRAADLLPPRALPDPAPLRRLGSSPIVNVHVVFDRPVLDHPFAAGVGTPVQWVFDRTAPSGLERGQYLAVSISAADREITERTETLRARLVPALRALLPRARRARVDRFFVTRELAATFRQEPGTRAHRPGTRTGVPGLFLAGAWTDTGWPATMEGAVRSGYAAAREALLATGRTRRVPEPVPEDASPLPHEVPA